MNRDDLQCGMRVECSEGDEIVCGTIVPLRYGRNRLAVELDNYAYELELRYMSKKQRYQASKGGSNGNYGAPVVVKRILNTDALVAADLLRDHGFDNEADRLLYGSHGHA